MNLLKRIVVYLWRALVHYWRSQPEWERAVAKTFVVFGLILAFIVVLVGYQDTKDAAADAEAERIRAVKAEQERAAFNKLTPAEHLKRAKSIWEPEHVNIDAALEHLRAIPESSPEHTEGYILFLDISAEKMLRDERNRRLAEERAQAEEAARAQQELAIQEQLQRQRDEDAQLSSYVPHTIRVNTDMNSFWLDQEERICQSYADDKNKVNAVSCNPTSREIHNIPVTFWGGVERGKSSSWKCRREGEKFVCRAID